MSRGSEEIISGAIFSGIFGGGDLLLNKTVNSLNSKNAINENYKIIGKQILEDGNADNLIKTGLEFNKTDSAYNLAKQLQDNPYKQTEQRLGQLVYEIKKQTKQNNASAQIETNSEYQNNVSNPIVAAINNYISDGSMTVGQRSLFSPSAENGAARALFAEMTGIELPETVYGTEAVLSENINKKALTESNGGNTTNLYQLLINKKRLAEKLHDESRLSAYSTNQNTFATIRDNAYNLLNSAAAPSTKALPQNGESLSLAASSNPYVPLSLSDNYSPYAALAVVENGSDSKVQDKPAKGLTNNGSGDIIWVDNNALNVKENIPDKNIKRLKHKASSGVELVSTPGKTTTILGTYINDTMNILNELGNVKSMDFGPKNGDFNLLNIPDEMFEKLQQKEFWEKYNKIWLENAIKRNDIILLATEPNYNNLHRHNKKTGKIELTGFGNEINYLKSKGYIYDSVNKIMVRKKETI